MMTCVAKERKPGTPYQLEITEDRSVNPEHGMPCEQLQVGVSIRA